MKARVFAKVTGLLMAAVMTGGMMFAAPVQEQGNYSDEASKLLKEIQSRAADLSYDASILESFTRSQPSWQTHAEHLARAGTHINAIGERLQRLNEIREVSAPWQKDAIDSLMPVAVSLANRTNAAIQHTKQNGRNLWSEVYTEHLRAISGHADQLKETVGLHLDLSSTQDKLDELRTRAATLGS